MKIVKIILLGIFLLSAVSGFVFVTSSCGDLCSNIGTYSENEDIQQLEDDTDEENPNIVENNEEDNQNDLGNEENPQDDQNNNENEQEDPNQGNNEGDALGDDLEDPEDQEQNEEEDPEDNNLEDPVQEDPVPEDDVSGDEVNQEEEPPPEEPEQQPEAEEEDPEPPIQEEPEEIVEDPEDSTDKIYITFLSVSQTVIRLANNGIGFDFIINFLPLDTTETIYVEIEDESIVNFASEIDQSLQSALVDFTAEGNKLYPLSKGTTELTIQAKSSSSETISVVCTVIVEDVGFPSLEVFDKDGESADNFMSGTKADGEYDLYTALFTLNKEIENKNLQILKTDGIQIIESSQNYYENEEFYYFSFDFYLLSNNNTLKISIEEDYINLIQTIFSNEINLMANSYVGELEIEVSREDLSSPLKDGEKYVLYYTEIDAQQADMDGYYNNYIIEIVEKSTCNAFDNFNITSSNENIVGIAEENEKIIARSFGTATITVSALDGSGQEVSIEIVVREIPPVLLEVEGLNLLSEYTQTDLENKLSGKFFYIPNNQGKVDCLELNILTSEYVTDEYIYFESEDLEITVEKDIVGENVSKNYLFESTTPGIYQVNLVLSGEIVFTFEIEVLNVVIYFDFYTDDPRGSEVIDYDFENNIITLSYNPETYNFINFCNKTKDQDMYLSFDSNFCVPEQNPTLTTIFLLLFKAENFILTITVKDGADILSTIQFSIVFN